MTLASATARPGLALRLALWLEDNVWLIAFVLAALAVRLHWNLEVHEPGDYIYSDMRGYMRRADGIFLDVAPPEGRVSTAEDAPWYFPFGVREYNAFYPYGTHVLLFLLQWPFGKESYPQMATAYAIFGAWTVGYAYALARRVSSNRVVPVLVGTLLVAYYPLVSLGGYFLSEVPFCLTLTAASFHVVRLIDHGRWRDAVWMGVWLALGTTLRPQILLSAACIGVFWLIRRKAMPRVTLKHWIVGLVPVLLMLAFSSWRLHYHTGRTGLISENGAFNQVYGRCHNTKITALPDTRDRRRTSFGPPPLIQLDKRAVRAPGQWPQLDPALEKEFEYRGYIGDSKILGDYVDRCMAETGWKGQAEYAVVNVAMQWRYNVMWPDSGKREWQGTARKWGLLVTNVLALPCILCMFSIFLPRRFIKLGVVSLHLWALTGVGALFLGGQRFRAPYDTVVILMALECVALLIGLGWWLVVRTKRATPSPSE